MYNLCSKSLAAIIGLATLPFLGGCAGDVVDLDTIAHQQLLQSDREDDARYIGQTIRIDLTEALDRAIAKNLDARVAEMDLVVQEGNATIKQLEVLPQVKTTRTTMVRSNLGASSSRSVESGLQSLEPSQSSDRRRLTSEMEASWNLLDSGLALAETYRMQDETGIARERYTKVIQNIERDVYAAYWQAWEYQKLKAGNKDVLKKADQQIRNLNNAIDKNLLSTDEGSDKISEIEDRKRNLQDLDQSLSSAEIELKTLLSYPQSANLELVSPPEIKANIKTLLNGNIRDQEWTALQSRPELREEVLQKNIAIKNVRQEIFKTLPGVNVLMSYNTDSNSFLQDNQWSSMSLGVTQNLLNTLTLPLRFAAAKTKEHQSDARRKALGVALIAQVHLARQRLSQTQDNCTDSKHAAKNALKKAYTKSAKSKAGFAAGEEKLVSELDGRISTVRQSLTCSDMQDSYAAMVNSLGQNLDHQTLLASNGGGQNGQ